MLVRRVVAECTFGGDVDLRVTSRRLGAFVVLEDYRETLTSRRRDALRWPVIFDGVVRTRTFGADEVHGIGIDRRVWARLRLIRNSGCRLSKRNSRASLLGVVVAPLIGLPLYCAL